MAKKQLKITVTDAGDLKIDASKMPGTSSQILEELKELAELTGGEANALVVEKHVHGAHTHTHEDSSVQTHN
jgi:hypothetical protein